MYSLRNVIEILDMLQPLGWVPYPNLLYTLQTTTISMAPSASKQKRLAEKAAKQAAKANAAAAGGSSTGTPTGSVNGGSTAGTPLTSLSAATSQEDLSAMAKLQLATDR